MWGVKGSRKGERRVGNPVFKMADESMADSVSSENFEFSPFPSCLRAPLKTTGDESGFLGLNAIIPGNSQRQATLGGRLGLRVSCPVSDN